MKTVALIPARGGSKGIPNKNIKSLLGRPLIVWSIEQALQSSMIDEVYVSTDSNEIARISKAAGASVPFIRPKALSDDTASTESVMVHFCEWAMSNRLDIDNLLLIQATSPVRLRNRFDDALKTFIESNKDSMLSVVKSHNFFWKQASTPKANYDYYKRPRRQDMKPEDLLFKETGSFYITKFKLFVKEKNRLCGSIHLYETPENESQEIDTITDFQMCEVLLNSLLGEKQ